jgi:hypothetical protein
VVRFKSIPVNLSLIVTNIGANPVKEFFDVEFSKKSSGLRLDTLEIVSERLYYVNP